MNMNLTKANGKFGEASRMAFDKIKIKIKITGNGKMTNSSGKYQNRTWNNGSGKY